MAAAVVLGAGLLYRLVTGYVAWTTQSTVFSQHVQSGARAACEQIRESCASSPDTASIGAGTTAKSGQVKSDELKYGRLIEILVCEKSAAKKKGLACDTWNPGSFAEFFVEKLSYDHALEKAIATWMTLMLLFLVAKLLAAESHLGWARLSIVAGGIFGVSGLAYSVSEQHKIVEVVVVLYGSTLLGVTAPLLVRRLFSWVQAGFTTPTSPSTASPQDDLETQATTATHKTGFRKIVLALGLVAFMAIAFLLNPDKTIQTFISTLVQALVLVIFIYGARAIYNEFMIWRK